MKKVLFQNIHLIRLHFISKETHFSPEPQSIFTKDAGTS